MSASTDLPIIRSVQMPNARFTVVQPAIVHPAVFHRSVLAAAVVAAITLAVTAAYDGASVRAAAVAGPELTRVLRFMALAKAALAAGALWAADRRLRQPATPLVAAAWIAACAAMAAATGLIWSIAHVVAGAAAFHAGLSLLLGFGLKDRASLPGVAGGVAGPAGRRAAGSGRPATRGPTGGPGSGGMNAPRERPSRALPLQRRAFSSDGTNHCVRGVIGEGRIEG